MKNINSINFCKLTNNGFMGFHNNAVDEAVSHTDQKRLTGIIDSTLDNIRTVITKEQYAQVFEGSDLETCFNTLQESQKAFDEASLTRLEERKLREQATNRELRDSCIDGFHNVMNVIQYNAITKGDESCQGAIDKVNSNAA